MHSEEYRSLYNAATLPDATQEDINALGEWLCQNCLES